MSYVVCDKKEKTKLFRKSLDVGQISVKFHQYDNQWIKESPLKNVVDKEASLNWISDMHNQVKLLLKIYTASGFELDEIHKFLKRTTYIHCDENYFEFKVSCGSRGSYEVVEMILTKYFNECRIKVEPADKNTTTFSLVVDYKQMQIYCLPLTMFHLAYEQTRGESGNKKYQVDLRASVYDNAVYFENSTTEYVIYSRI